MDENIRKAADLLKNAQYGVALTGAGISTPSGIPDFRSADSGVWNHVNPFEVASLPGFLAKPEAFYNWLRPLAGTVLNAKPNPAHTALADLERKGRIQCVITQNIDMLHTRAGSRHVLEVHGHLREATCMRCYKVYRADPFIDEFMTTGAIPHCPSCAGVLKPNVILFGEALPEREFAAAKEATNRCDVMLVAGSSLEVAPINDFPIQTLEHEASLILVNFDKTYVDSRAKVVIHGDVARVLPQIADALEA